ncbi:MAG: FecCD family ABC transporter permease [Chitinophagales bacterium]
MLSNQLKNGIILILILVLILVCILGITWGAVAVPIKEILQTVALHIPFLEHLISPVSSSTDSIIWQIRLPRVVLAGLVGMALAMAGVGYQGMFNNPMADPHILGVSQGAACGACLAMIMQNHLQLPEWMIPVAAFVGAVAAMMLIYFLAKQNGRLPVMRLLLSGLILGTLLSALLSLLVYFSDQQLHRVVYWLMGGFSARNWGHVNMVVFYIIAGGLLMLCMPRELNLLRLGEENAQHLGVEIELAKRIILFCAALLTASAVAAGGVIGFVGLIMPHAARLLVGHDHRILLPASALLGAGFLVASDLIARTLMAPLELPVGVITSLIGAPFFIYLMYRSNNELV